VAFSVYDRAVANDTVPMVDNSRSAKVFASFQANIDKNMPADAPAWIVGRYEQLVGSCGAPVTPVPAETAPAAEPAPAN